MGLAQITLRAPRFPVVLLENPLPAVLAALGWVALAQAATEPHLLTDFSTGSGSALAASTTWVKALLHGSGSGMLLHGAAMGAIMLVPSAIAPLRHVRGSSYRSARLRHAWLFILPFVLAWSLFGAAAMAGALVLAVPGGKAGLIAASAACAVAGAWQFSRWKGLALAKCHMTPPVYSGGLAGALSAIRFGWSISGACMLSCGPAMAAAMLSPLPVPAMAAAMLMTIRESSAQGRVLRQHAVTLAAGGAVLLLLALSPGPH